MSLANLGDRFDNHFIELQHFAALGSPERFLLIGAKPLRSKIFLGFKSVQRAVIGLIMKRSPKAIGNYCL